MKDIKKFEDFLDRMQGLLDEAKKQGHIIVRIEDIENTFPELKESEDERVRKKLIDLIYKVYANTSYITCVEHEDMLAWLEKQGEFKSNKWTEGDVVRHGGVLALVINGRKAMKSNCEQITIQYPDEWVKTGTKERKYFFEELEKQGEQNLIMANSPQLGEQKTTDKVESKFHEGDWVILTAGELSTTLQIVSVDINKKLYWFNDSSYLPIVDEECLHHWTIQDAKDGDVLASGQLVFIFNVIHGVWLNCHCSVHNDGSLITDSYDLMIAKYFSEVHPATKKQRDTLEKAMADAGYTFDFGKKELKKIEQNPAWGEDDEKMIDSSVNNLTELMHRYGEKYGNVGKCIDWLKSLKDRYTWKPSEEQMEAVKRASNGSRAIAGKDYLIMESLYNDLEKLTE